MLLPLIDEYDEDKGNLLKSKEFMELIKSYGDVLNGYKSYKTKFNEQIKTMRELENQKQVNSFDYETARDKSLKFKRQIDSRKESIVKLETSIYTLADEVGYDVSTIERNDSDKYSREYKMTDDRVNIGDILNTLVGEFQYIITDINNLSEDFYANIQLTNTDNDITILKKYINYKYEQSLEYHGEDKVENDLKDVYLDYKETAQKEELRAVLIEYDIVDEEYVNDWFLAKQ